MTFLDELQVWPASRLQAHLAQVSSEQVLGILQAAEAGQALSRSDFLSLLSPVAAKHLEGMAQLAQALTLRHFGRTIQLFTPLYLANFCSNSCVYCGFNRNNDIVRSKLSPEQIVAEVKAIASTGLRQILLLTGEAPAKAGIDYLEAACRLVHDYFPSIGVEIYPMSTEEYARLVACHVDSMTMFQETYNAELYPILHPAGPKHDFLWRLHAPQRAAEASMRALNVGALLGLDAWPLDAFYTGLHAAWLMDNYPGIDLAISTPRIRPHEGSFTQLHDITDYNLVQYIVACRIFRPTVGLTLSTRENPQLRENLIPLGITKISAGVCTAVGGHTQSSETPEAETPPQFAIADERDVHSMVECLHKLGYQPVFKNWEPLLPAKS